MEEAVTTLDELTSGDDTRGAGAHICASPQLCLSHTSARYTYVPMQAEFHGMEHDALVCALRCLELDGRAKCVRAASGQAA